MIEFIEEDKELDRPFFAYLSFRQHIPLRHPKSLSKNTWPNRGWLGSSKREKKK
ncbi:MAG: hypothetical protein CM15mP22_8430 [Gammaproteobacteria bacterium]|nr:MAG: hypothetical protein CM15mP22_8430 [Gammaproteobacteria bacterium]